MEGEGESKRKEKEEENEGGRKRRIILDQSNTKSKNDLVLHARNILPDQNVQPLLLFCFALLLYQLGQKCSEDHSLKQSEQVEEQCLLFHSPHSHNSSVVEVLIFIPSVASQALLPITWRLKRDR